DESDTELQLLAAARVLQVEDAARFGRDVVAGIAALAADGFAGALPADYAEYAVGCYLARAHDAGEVARLRILLIGAAVDHRLGLMFGLWRTRAAKAWQVVGPADTAFDLARTSPPTAARVLAKFPDLLLFHRPEPAVEDLVGPVLVCARGVAVGGHLVADPD